MYQERTETEFSVPVTTSLKRPADLQGVNLEGGNICRTAIVSRCRALWKPMHQDDERCSRNRGADEPRVNEKRLRRIQRDLVATDIYTSRSD